MSEDQIPMPVKQITKEEPADRLRKPGPFDVAPPVSMDVVLDLTHPGFQTRSGTPDQRKIGRMLRMLGAQFAVPGDKKISELSGSLIMMHDGLPKRAGYWIIHTNDKES